MIKYEFNLSDACQRIGVYCIHIGNHTYIGSTKRNIWVRIKEHERLLKHNKHYNKKLQLVYNQIKEVTFSVVEYCNLVDICAKEQYYINKWNPDLNIIQNVAYYN